MKPSSQSIQRQCWWCYNNELVHLEGGH